MQESYENPPSETPPSLPRSSSPVETETTIATRQKQNLNEIDHGRCLITCQEDPLTVRACHILSCKSDKVKRYQAMWGLEELNVDSTSNLVSLRADWQTSYDNSTWAFVPTMDVLKKIEKAGERGTYAKPYSGFSASATGYTFIHFPTFCRKAIHRDKFNHKEVNTYWAYDDFTGFPILYHHAHPYLVIANALPKFCLHITHLPMEQREIFQSMLRIRSIWLKKAEQRAPKQATKRKRDDSNSGPEGGDGRNRGARKSKRRLPVMNPPAKQLPTKLHRRRQVPGCEESGGVDKPCLAPSPPASSQTIHAHNDVTSYYDQKEHVLAWVNSIIMTGPLTPAEDIITPDNEIGREPYEGDWHDWCYPWTQPPKASMFSSNDWAMQHVMCKLTAKPGCWDHSSLEGTSDGEVDWETGAESLI